MKPSKPLLIGLTGGIACGKSHLSQALKEHGVTVIDADQISRSLTAPGGAALPDVRAAFGDGVFSGEELDRAKLAQRVFGDEAALKTLNGILHPMVFEAIEQAIHDNHHQPALVLDIPLLYETGYDKRCGAVFCAWAPEATQLERLKERGLSEEEARARIGSQMSALEKAKRADRLIITTGSREESARAIWNIYQETIRRHSIV